MVLYLKLLLARVMFSLPCSTEPGFSTGTYCGKPRTPGPPNEAIATVLPSLPPLMPSPAFSVGTQISARALGPQQVELSCLHLCTGLLSPPGGAEGAPGQGPQPHQESLFPECGPGSVPGRGMCVCCSGPEERWGGLRLLRRLLLRAAIRPHHQCVPRPGLGLGTRIWTFWRRVSLGLQEVGTAWKMDDCGG